VLLVDKPDGMTSHDVVAIVRRATGVTRVGHTGTLDPFATGLLVMLVGRATRLLPYVDGEPKVYEAAIGLGIETDTDDRTGAVVREAPPPSRAQIDDAIALLTGTLDQVPPAYSAKQQGGTRSYAAARRGQTLDLAPARVVVDSWQVLDHTPAELRVRISCGTGTYVRALARDLGRLAGSAAHLTELRRTRAGDFDVAAAATMDDIRAGRWTVLPPTHAVGSLPERRLDAGESAALRHGVAITPVPEDGPELVAGVDENGRLVAVLRREGDRLRPRVVLADA
jgi:tRNA pseudouridine55 synthase